MASAEKYSSGNAFKNFGVIFIKIVWFSMGNTIKIFETSMWFFFEISVIFKRSLPGAATFLYCTLGPAVAARHFSIFFVYPEILSILSVTGGFSGEGLFWGTHQVLLFSQEQEVMPCSLTSCSPTAVLTSFSSEPYICFFG